MHVTEERLVEETLELPRREAARWRHTPLEQEDLVGEGCVGLTKAARRYDPSLGVPFAAFAMHYVRGAITDFVRSRARRQRLADGSFVDVFGFDDLHGGSEGNATTFEPTDPGPTPHDTLVNLDKLRVIATLPDRERVAIIRTVVHGDDAADVAATLGVSPNRVYALVHTGTARLRKRAA